MSASLKDSIAHDHREMYAYYDQYKQARAQGDAAAEGRWARQLIWEVARHAVGEEIVVYPLMEKYLGEEGMKLADQDRADHQTVKEQLYRLESLTPGSPEYDQTLANAMSELHEHNDSEEVNDLPLLEQKLSQEDLEAASRSFKRTKHFVPTRAHPSAPNKPPYETFAGFLAAPIDKLKDYFSSFPSEEEKERAGL